MLGHCREGVCAGSCRPGFERHHAGFEFACFQRAAVGFHKRHDVAPSAGVSSPSATAASTAAAPLAASAADCMAGSMKMTGASRPGGAIRSRHKRSAVVSPASASSTALRVRASASPSRKRQCRLGGPVARALGLAGIAGGEGSVRIASAVTVHVAPSVHRPKPRSLPDRRRKAIAESCLPPRPA